ncbi:MAG TPA: hypothetical protein DDW52_08765 [Planctomycetaceae bacterium]|nr:hypothetical protein [Planctomycetaceae bacterium]
MGVITLFFACLQPLPTAAAPPKELRLRGLPQLTESSGVCIDDKGHIWTHNDSGDEAVLYGFDQQGQHRDTLRLTSTTAIDWEDICLVRHAGRTWIAVGDIGDNGRSRKTVYIHIIECPASNPAKEATASPRELKASPAATIEFTYPGGPLDAESLCFDPIKMSFVIGSKEFVGCRLFEIPIGKLAIFQPSAKEPGKSQPVSNPTRITTRASATETVAFPLATGADISPDGKMLVLCGYGPGALVPRKQDTWETTAIRIFPLPKRRQGEAICFLPDASSLLLTSELGPNPESSETPLHVIATPQVKPGKSPR